MKTKTIIEPTAIEPVSGVTTRGFTVALCVEDDSNQHYLLNTDRFKQFIPKYSVIEVSPNDRLKPGNLALVSGAAGLKILPYKRDARCQVVGKVIHVERWPGQVVKSWKA